MPDRNVWHGINVVALLDRARRDRVPPGVDADPRVLAGRILAVVEAKDQEQTADMWDFGTAMEACVALGNVTGALGWVERYIRSDHADAFELASTLRQMEELWGMDESQDPGRVLLPVLRGALLRKEGSSVQLDARSAEAAPDDGVVDYEAVLGRESFRSIRWWRTAMVRVHSIARVESTRGAEGSGFLIDSQDLWPDHPRRVLFVTNHHVVRNAESGATRVHFTTWTRKPNEFLIDRVLASSTEGARYRDRGAEASRRAGKGSSMRGESPQSSRPGRTSAAVHHRPSRRRRADDFPVRQSLPGDRGAVRPLPEPDHAWPLGLAGLQRPVAAGGVPSRVPTRDRQRGLQRRRPDQGDPKPDSTRLRALFRGFPLGPGSRLLLRWPTDLHARGCGVSSARFTDAASREPRGPRDWSAPPVAARRLGPGSSPKTPRVAEFPDDDRS